MMQDYFAQRLRVLRIIIAAMSFGLLAFTVVVTVSVVTGAMEINDAPASIYLTILGMMAAGELVAYFVMRQATLKSTREKVESQTQEDQRELALVGGYAVLTIIGGAMVEGLGLFGAVIVLLTGRVEIAFAPGLAIVLLMILVFPTKAKAAGFVAAVTGEHRTMDQT